MGELSGEAAKSNNRVKYKLCFSKAFVLTKKENLTALTSEEEKKISNNVEVLAPPGEINPSSN